MVDQVPGDRTIRDAADADYPYIGIDTAHLDVAATVECARSAIPEVYAGQSFTLNADPDEMRRPRDEALPSPWCSDSALQLRR